MSTFIFSLLNLICGSIATLIVFGFEAILRNLPAILSTLENLFARVSRSAYRLLHVLVHQVYSHTRLPIHQLPYRLVATGLFTSAIWMLICVVSSTPAVWWHIALAAVYGIYIGWVWHDFEYPEGLWLGEDI